MVLLGSSPGHVHGPAVGSLKGEDIASYQLLGEKTLMTVNHFLQDIY